VVYSATAESRIKELEQLVVEIKQHEIELWDKIEEKYKNTIIYENLKLEFEYEKKIERDCFLNKLNELKKKRKIC